MNLWSGVQCTVHYSVLICAVSAVQVVLDKSFCKVNKQPVQLRPKSCALTAAPHSHTAWFGSIIEPKLIHSPAVTMQNVVTLNYLTVPRERIRLSS